ncbi:aspartate kinase [Bacillaceae bacterium SIJ1]|uniref:aspartate kinase n=1 Tax=Litoribacterium kuwaitense TaxID=1398745 RepID=UPI0013EB60DD|nr:aspartate kinase [Litoribacterium kuwaitense]NGP44077.1 aspartate kinase [Litoribacterium kuwaitense]
MAKVIVQKFGGTSVKDETSRQKAVAHVKRALAEGYKVVVVVSAIGRKGAPYATDTLLSLLSSETDARAMDLMASCGEIISSVVFQDLLKARGISAVAMTGAQAGFKTTSDFGDAKITEMCCDQVTSAFETYDCVVVAGFQGMDEEGNVTTLGRGGSDTSASALGAALGADWIDIFTDVEGVMTADPRIVKDARPLPMVTYTEICNMAYQGAKVIHPRAVEIAMQAKIPIRVRSTHSEAPGTLVTALVKPTDRVTDVHDNVVTGITHVADVSQITVVAEEEQRLPQADIFKAMADQGISVDFISITPRTVTYTVQKEATLRTETLLKSLGLSPRIRKNCAKVSAVGAGMTGVPGVISTIVQSLSGEGIEILQSADSHTTIWVLVDGVHLEKAVNALHKTFLSSFRDKRIADDEDETLRV